MRSIHDIPEVGSHHKASGLVRIPPEMDVPLTPRVRRLIDTSAFRRLTRISQLGLVSLVYPAANHTRQEHSLGVYRVAIQFLQRLASNERFAAVVPPDQAELFLVAALLHDIGHWPYCHPIEDMALATVPKHEQFAREFLESDEISQALEEDWGLTSSDVIALLTGKRDDTAGRVLRSMLSGPIDVDKVDYLMRDSLHAGVPYGRNFDQGRLIASLCLNEAGNGLAISTKGKTAAEMMVFSRYVMFSEVYWHHAVRSATAMLQRAFFDLHESLSCDALFQLAEQPFCEALLAAAEGQPAGELLAGIFGPRRELYKRIAQFSFTESPEVFKQLSHRPFDELVACASHLAKGVGKALKTEIAPHELLVDAPPRKLEVQFDIEVFDAKQDVYRRLGEISPVVHSLAKNQFDNYVKQVRLFAHPRIADQLRGLPNINELLTEAIARV